MKLQKKKKFKKVILIPARSGSKRLKNKNILKIKNKTLISFTISQALKVKNIDYVIVSTDNRKFLASAVQKFFILDQKIFLRILQATYNYLNLMRSG